MTRAAGWRNALGPAAVVIVAVAAGLVLQPPGCNQTAHLALVKALADGTPRIDRYEAETCDDAYIGEHFYAAKAPGLALLTAPWYVVLDAAGLAAHDTTRSLGWPAAMVELRREEIWQASVWGATVPFALLLLLLRWSANRLVPGYGTVTAVSTGMATLLLPFATLLFAHVLSATLGFAAFCLLLLARERDGPMTGTVAAAGVLAGLAVVVEFPLVLVAACLAVYAATHGDAARRLVTFGIGALVGIAPLFVFDTWAFGQPFRISYTHAVIDPGATGHDVVGANDHGLFGLVSPSPHALVELLASGRGLLVLTPVTAAAAVGLVLLAHGGRRAEGLLAGAVVALFLAYTMSYYLPFGGWVPGPRFLVPVMPFLGLGLAAAYRACWPATLALAAVSAGWMVVATLGEPLIETDDTFQWLHRVRDGRLAPTLVTTLGGGASAAVTLPVIACLVVAAGIAVACLPRPPVSARDVRLTVTALAGWLVVSASVPDLLRLDTATDGWVGALAGSCVLAAVALACSAAWRDDGRALALSAVLVVLALPAFGDHSKWSLAVALAVLCALAALDGTRRRRPRTG